MGTHSLKLGREIGRAMVSDLYLSSVRKAVPTLWWTGIDPDIVFSWFPFCGYAFLLTAVVNTDYVGFLNTLWLFLSCITFRDCLHVLPVLRGFPSGTPVAFPVQRHVVS